MQEAALQAGEIPGGPDWGKEPESEKGLLHTEKDGKIIKEYIPSERGNYLDYYEGIFQALRNHKNPPVTADEGLDVIRVIEAAQESSSSRSVVAFRES